MVDKITPKWCVQQWVKHRGAVSDNAVICVISQNPYVKSAQDHWFYRWKDGEITYDPSLSFPITAPQYVEINLHRAQEHGDPVWFTESFRDDIRQLQWGIDLEGRPLNGALVR